MRQTSHLRISSPSHAFDATLIKLSRLVGSPWLVAIGINNENHGLAARLGFPSGQHRGPNTPGNNSIADLETTSLHSFQQAFRRGKFQQGTALGMFPQQGNGHALPASRLSPLGLALQFPLILMPVDVNDTGMPVDVAHAHAPSRSVTANHTRGASSRLLPWTSSFGCHGLLGPAARTPNHRRR